MNPGPRNIDGIMVMGDTHGQWWKLNEVIAQKKPSIILQCGDFGFWPGHERYDLKKIKTNGTKIYWACGNHENHHELQKLCQKLNPSGLKEPIEIEENIFYCPRGSSMTLPDGRTVFFMGGANSIDKDQRTPGYDWFPEETIKQKDMLNLPDIEVDILITHTCCKSNLGEVLDSNWLKALDPSYDAIEYLTDLYRPNLWMFGHFHNFRTGQMDNTKWFCLGHSDQQGFWIWLPNEGRKILT